MKYIYSGLWFAALLLVVFTLGVRYGERLPAKYPTMPAVSPIHDFGCDNPNLRLYMYGLNPNVQFAYDIVERPHLAGLADRPGMYQLWDRQQIDYIE